jgi:hypothetical protein
MCSTKVFTLFIVPNQWCSCHPMITNLAEFSAAVRPGKVIAKHHPAPSCQGRDEQYSTEVNHTILPNTP